MYWCYLGATFLHGDLGPSYQYRDTTVNEIIRQGFPVDFVIGIVALGASILIGLPIGILGAMKRNSGWDHVPMALAMIGISIPVFVVAPILILVFAVNLHYWLPAGSCRPWVACVCFAAGGGAVCALHCLRCQIDAWQHG